MCVEKENSSVFQNRDCLPLFFFLKHNIGFVFNGKASKVTGKENDKQLSALECTPMIKFQLEIGSYFASPFGKKNLKQS